ncbi:hypothetical protein NQ317_001017 [Molorchus minor]|uniref:glycerol kinase n=1 Tax=Molorchus minor TaxID=1323400 RepID=A0ABQ9IQM6_9CUCU|nr:hypothetical protein NQ317_001017 [Molorchus minor]
MLNFVIKNLDEVVSPPPKKIRAVWMDMRTSSTVDEILQNGKRPQNFIQNLCGLPVSTYFSALKIKWMMDNVVGVKQAIEEEGAYLEMLIVGCELRNKE